MDPSFFPNFDDERSNQREEVGFTAAEFFEGAGNHSNQLFSFEDINQQAFRREGFGTRKGPVVLHQGYEYQDDEQDTFDQRQAFDQYYEQAAHEQQDYDAHPAPSEDIDDAETVNEEAAEEETAAAVPDDFAPYIPKNLGSAPKRSTVKKDWKDVQGAVPQRLWYQFPKDAQGPIAPLPEVVKYKKCSPRQMAEWLQSGHKLDAIVSKIDKMPLINTQNRKEGKSKRAGKARTPTQIVQNRFSERNQRYRQANGILARNLPEGQALPKEYIRALLPLSNAQLFYRVIGKVEAGSFEMSAPADLYHGSAADPTMRCALPVPKDIHPSIRKALEEAGRELPEFLEFLGRHPDRVQYYNLDPTTGKPIDGGEEKEQKRRKTKTKQSSSHSTRPERPLGSLAPASIQAEGGDENEYFTEEEVAQQPQWKPHQSYPPQSRSRKRGADEDEEDSAERSKKRKTYRPAYNNDALQYAPHHGEQYGTNEEIFGFEQVSGLTALYDGRFMDRDSGAPWFAPCPEGQGYEIQNEQVVGGQQDFSAFDLQNGFQGYYHNSGYEPGSNSPQDAPGFSGGPYHMTRTQLFNQTAEQSAMPNLTTDDTFANLPGAPTFDFDNTNHFDNGGSVWDVEYAAAYTPASGPNHGTGNVQEQGQGWANGGEAGLNEDEDFGTGFGAETGLEGVQGLGSGFEQKFLDPLFQ